MDWNEKLQIIINYVENHLQRDQEPINLQEISDIAGCSIGFFQKVFSYMNGMSFAEYVRSRKLTLAGYDLKSTNLRVIDISYRYGYDSPTSFTKAFQQFHGITPRAARDVNAKLRIVPKMQIISKQEYSWRIEEKPAFRLIGKSIEYSQGEQYTKIPEFWSNCQRDGTFSHLISIDQGTPQGLFGLYHGDNSCSQKKEYSIMVISDMDLPDGYCEVLVPATTWAIFDCKGPSPQAITKWLPKSNYKPLNKGYMTGRMKSGAPDIEHYNADGSVEVWIAVQEK